MNIIINNIKELTSRPDFDTYFMSMSYLASSRSTCDRLHVGCLVVKDKHVIATGYNGNIAGLPHDSLIIDNHEQLTIHAEMNAICYSNLNGTSLKDSTVYITHFPCLKCTQLLLTCKISKIFYHEDYKNDSNVISLCAQCNVPLIKLEIVN